jgi:hypothetical protein
MVFAVLSERYSRFVKNNEAAAYLDEKFPAENITYLMRNSSFDKETGTINISSYLGYLVNYFEIKRTISEADMIWLRMPSQWTVLFSLIFGLQIRRKKKVIHLCANRLTFSFLRRNLTVKNFLRFVYGIWMVIYLKLFWGDCTYYYTGCHVKRNFYLRRGDYLIDQRHNTSMKREDIITNKYCYFGRLDKLKDDALLDYLRLSGIELHCYGSGSKLNVENLHYFGFVAAADVAKTMADYSHYIHAGAEYYEGFPRTLFIAQSLGLECIVSKKSTFFNDITGSVATYD